MALLEINQSRQITATIRLEEKTAAMVDQYAAFIRASADDVVNHALVGPEIQRPSPGR